jgi:hypothetical protein
MITYTLRKSGPVFNGQRVDGRKQLTKAAYVTLQKGKKIAQGKTPVDTGRLRGGWEIVVANAALENAVPYSTYVEAGTTKMSGRFYARDSVPEIEKIFGEMIVKYVGQAYGF